MFSHLTKDFFSNRQARAISVPFFSIGFAFGSWAAYIPYIKDKFSLEDSQLGLLLLCFPIGSLLTNPLAAFLVHKYGMKEVTLWAMVFLALAFTIPLNAPVIPILCIGMILCGASITLLNVAMNTCVNAIEESKHINIMSTCHGLFSLGLMVGSFLAGFAKKAALIPGQYILYISLIIIISLLIIRKTILSIEDRQYEEAPQGKTNFIPSGVLLIMVIISICINMTEGTMVDWTAIYMNEIVHSKPFYVGWGLVGYSFFMALGRFFGDKIIPIYGPNKVLVNGGILSLLGILIAIFLPYTFSAIVGFSLVGAGVSCGAPILYSSAAKVPGLKKGAGLAIMNTYAMGGFLLGPVIIGFLAQSFGLQIAFSVLAVLALIWIYNSRKIKLF